MDTSINITASQIETLQTALLMERQDRNALQHRVQELEEVIRVLGTKFQHTSKERDDEIAKSNLFSDYVSEIRSPALIIRTVTALLKYPSIHVVCLLKVSSEWAVISDRSDDHIFIESSQLDDVIDFFEKQTVSIDRVSALPPSVVNAINLAYEKKFDSIQTSNNNMIFSAISRDTIWVVVSDLSLQPLLETFLGLSALLLIATRLIIEAFKRQLEDIEILETSLIRKASDQIFQELFITSDIVCSKDFKEKLQSLLLIVNSLYTSCSSELFIVDGNKVALTSQLAYIPLAQYESSSVLLTAISEQRLALCMDPLNAHRNRLLDCGNVVAPIPIILALPLWTSDNKSSATSNSNCQAFLLLRIFDNFNPTQYVKLAEDLVAGIGAMLQFWTRQHMHILLTHRSLEEDFERRPPLNQRDFLTSAIEGLKSLTGSSNILTVANLIQCSWLIFIELRVEFGDEACLSSENLCMYNDIGEKRSFQLSETKNEFRGFLSSLFGIIDDGLYSHSSRSGDEGSLHLLNGMKVRGSGLQSLLRITIPEIVNLVGIRVRHPDHDFHDSSAKHLRSLVVIGGRSWGTFVAQELRTSSLPMLTSIFEFTSDHRSLVRRCDAISSAASQMTSTSDTISMRRQVHDEALRLLSDSLNGLNALADVSTTAQYRKKLFNSIKGLGESFEVSLSLYFYEDIFLQWWELTQDGEWEKIKGSHLESIDALQARPLMKLFDASNAKSVIVERIRSGFGFKGLMLLSAEPLKALSSILSGEWDGNFAALLLSISAILSSQAALHSNVMFGTAPISSSSSFPNPFLPLSSVDLESDLSVDCALMGSSLLHSFTDAFYPTFRLLPLYLSSESSIDIINTTALPPQLCSGLRSAHHRAISNSTSASSSALHLLENSEAYMAYFHKVVGRSETNTVNCERVYLFTNGSFQNIASDNDSVVVLVLICATFLIHPSFLTTLDRYIFERLLPFIYLNRCSTPLAQELRRHPFKVVPESSQATTDAIPKEVIETPLTYVENNAKLDTRDDVLETISAKLSFHSTLLRSLFGFLATRNLLEVITSSLENTGNTWLGCNTPGVVICWAGDEHLSSSLGVVCKEAVKQMLAKGTASSRVDLSSDGTFIRVSYVPIISGERLIAVLQLPESRPDRVLDEQLLIKNVESMVTSTADLMANGSVDMNSNSTPYFKFSTMISSLLRGIPLSQSSILRESGARISESLSGLLNLNVCIAIKEASSGFYCGKLYGSNVTAIENIHFVSQDFLSRIGSDLGVSVYPSAFISSGSNNREVYQLVRKFEAEDAIIIIESQDRMPAMAVHCVNFLVSTIEFACQAHLTERRKKSYENKLAFEQYSKTLRAARDEQSLLQLLNSKLHEVLTVRKSCVITISREEQLGEDMILKGTNKEEDFSSFSLQRIAAHCLSSDTNIVCEKGCRQSVAPSLFIPLHSSWALYLEFKDISLLHSFVELTGEEMDTLRDHGSLFDALRVREEIQRWREDRHWWLSQVNDVPEGEPMLLHLRLYEAFVSFFQYTIVPVSGTPDHPSSTSSQRGPDEATFLPSMKYSSDVHSALPSRSLTEVLAIEFAEFFETSETRSDIYDFKLHWKPTDEGGKQSSWMTIVKDPSKDNAFTARSSSSQALLRTVYRKQIIMLNSPSSPTSTSIFLSIAPDKVMEFSLCFSLLDSMAPLDWTHEEGKGFVDSNSNAKQAWKTLLSIQQLGKLLISLRERIAEGDDITQTLQQKVDMQVSLLNLMRDCVFDIYDQSKALDASAVTATSRSAKCLQAVQCHLNRLPTVINVTIEFKSPAGQVYNSVTQRLLEESEARPSPTSGRSSKLWDTKSISESSAGDNSRFSRDFVFECHEIQGKITLIFSSPLVDKTEACVSTVVCTLAKLLSRRLYELDKAARNRVYLKSKAEEIVKRRRETTILLEQKAVIAAALEASLFEVEELKVSIDRLRQQREEEINLFEAQVRFSEESVDAHRTEMQRKLCESEEEANSLREKFLKMEEEMRALESEKIRAERLACSLQDTLTNSEKEMQRVEEERKTALELVQTAHVAHFEAEQEAARRDCHYQQELAKIEAERAEDLQSYEEVRARTASSLEQRPKYTDSTVLALLKEVAEMKAEKERALQKIMKRDLQLKDAMVLVENLQMSHNAVKEESSHALESLQIENMRLLQELEERRQKEKIQVENKQLEGSIELSGEKVALGILKGTLEDARKSLQQKDQDLVDLRQKYDEATKLPTVDEPRTEVNQLRDEVLALKRVLAEKNEEIKIWKQKFAVQERERETLIEGWKDIVATAGSPKTRKMYSPGTNSSRSSK